jgi:hypothetical protein
MLDLSNLNVDALVAKAEQKARASVTQQSLEQEIAEFLQDVREEVAVAEVITNGANGNQMVVLANAKTVRLNAGNGIYPPSKWLDVLEKGQVVTTAMIEGKLRIVNVAS